MEFLDVHFLLKIAKVSILISFCSQVFTFFNSSSANFCLHSIVLNFPFLSNSANSEALSESITSLSVVFSKFSGILFPHWDLVLSLLIGCFMVCGSHSYLKLPFSYIVCILL